jgi:hypothetical protein
MPVMPPLAPTAAVDAGQAAAAIEVFVKFSNFIHIKVIFFMVIASWTMYIYIY